jgi:hypothetical protein
MAVIEVSICMIEYNYRYAAGTGKFEDALRFSFFGGPETSVEGVSLPRRQPSLLVRSGGHSARESVESHRRLSRTRN